MNAGNKAFAILRADLDAKRGCPRMSATKTIAGRERPGSPLLGLPAGACLRADTHRQAAQAGEAVRGSEPDKNEAGSTLPLRSEWRDAR